MKDTTLRGKLLEFLKDIYPEGAESRAIASVFYEYHKYNGIMQSLEYLADKGYVLCKKISHPYKSNETLSMYKISPAGIDLIEGTTIDPGVAILPEVQ